MAKFVLMMVDGKPCEVEALSARIQDGWLLFNDERGNTARGYAPGIVQSFEKLKEQESN